MKATGPYTSELWQSIQSIYEAMITHPFIVGLADGTLPEKAFAHYLTQDMLYLKDDAIAFEKLAQRLADGKGKDLFHSLAVDGYAYEDALHQEYIHYFDLSTPHLKDKAVTSYTAFLFAQAEKSTPAVAAAALLPCFWLYNKVGQSLLPRSVAQNPYQKWINTYDDDTYEQYTKDFIAIVEDLATTNEDAFENMKRVFIKASEYELAFFEESYEKGIE